MRRTRSTAGVHKHAHASSGRFRKVKLKLLPSTFESDGSASPRQHLTCFVVDDKVAFDAGSLAMSITPVQKRQIRDVVLTHAHLDHIAGLPLFIDDLFATLNGPILVHATPDVIRVLERDIFNWSVYPQFSELMNRYGRVIEYVPFEPGSEFIVRHLRVRSLEVNHKVPSTGFIVRDASTTFVMTGDTAETSSFWKSVNEIEYLSAILIECAFPNELVDLAITSHHLTPDRLAKELEQCTQSECPIYAINLKPMYRDKIMSQLERLRIPNLEVFEVGREYEW